MIKVLVLLVFGYNLYNTISDPTAKNVAMGIILLLVGLSLFVSTGKKVVKIIIKVVAIVAIIAYVLMHFGVIA